MKPQKDKNAAKNFPVICVGGSAGGLDSYLNNCVTIGKRIENTFASY